MRLSEAIRLGAMLKPQHFGSLRSDDGVATCALGAAEEASGERWQVWYGQHPACLQDTACPACTYVPRFDLNQEPTIAHLNDTHRWTREQIADWVETIEQQAGAQDSGGELIESGSVAPAVETLITVTR